MTTDIYKHKETHIPDPNVPPVVLPYFASRLRRYPCPLELCFSEREHFKESVPDLLGAGPVDEGVEGWRQQ